MGHDESADPPATAPAPAPALAVLVVVAATMAATAAQGGFHRAGKLVVAVLILLAAVSAGRRAWVALLDRYDRLLVGGLASLAAWAIARAAFDGRPVRAMGIAGTIAVVLVVLAACAGASDGDIDLLEMAVLSIGVLVAAGGLVAVALRVEPFALARGTTWRAASTLTYPNAAAAIVVMALMVAVGRLMERPDERLLAAAASLLLVGLGATQSRGGVLAAAAGLAVVAVHRGIYPLARALRGPFTGALIALAGVLAGVGIDSPRRAGLALVACMAGLGVGVVGHRGVGRVRGAAPAGDGSFEAQQGRATRRPDRVANGMWFAIVALAAIVLVRWLPIDRLTFASGDRAGASRAAVRVLRAHPLAGVGPGALRVGWNESAGAYSTRLVHDEFLQLGAELGAVGLALLALAVAGVLRSWRPLGIAHGGRSRLGAVAALAALTVHSALDFLWHVPAVVLVGAVLLGVACRRPISPNPASRSPRGALQLLRPTAHHPGAPANNLQ